MIFDAIGKEIGSPEKKSSVWMKRENHCQLICAQYVRTVSRNTVFLAPALPLKITQPELIYLYTRANETKLVCYRERNATA